MSEDARKHDRTTFHARIKLWHEGQTYVLRTSDVSYGGVFLVLDPSQVPPVGSEVNVQIQDAGASPPIQRMRVVRTTSTGIGLQFLDSHDQTVRSDAVA